MAYANQSNYGTGRRKAAVARVYIKAGSGNIVVNKKPLDQFFSRETGRMLVRQPLEVTDSSSTFDIQVNVTGGGETGQAGAVRHGIARALVDYDASLKPANSVIAFNVLDNLTMSVSGLIGPIWVIASFCMSPICFSIIMRSVSEPLPSAMLIDTSMLAFHARGSIGTNSFVSLTMRG